MWRARRSNHFPHKTDFARAWGQGRRDELAAVGEHVPADESAGALVHRYFAALAEMNERERDLTRAMLQSLTPNEIFLYIRAVPSEAIRRGQERGEFNLAADPGAAAEILTSVYFGAVSRWLIDGPPPLISRRPSPTDSSWCWSDYRRTEQLAESRDVFARTSRPIHKGITQPNG